MVVTIEKAIHNIPQSIASNAKENTLSIPTGYKLTEVGVIPQDWKVVPLGEMFSFKNGLNKAKQYFGYGTPIVNYMDVFQLSGIRNSDIKGRVNVNSQELQAYEVLKGDVFFTRTSETVEEIGITSVMLDESKQTVFSGFVLRGRPKDNSLANQFKRFCFSSRITRLQITSKSTYTTRALTNGRILAGILLPLPPLQEQCAIAAALNDIDTLIAFQKELIAKKQDIKQATMQHLLKGRIRLPGFTGEWENKKLGKVASFIKGSGLSKSAITIDSGNPCILYGELFTRYTRVIQTVINKTKEKIGVRSKYGDILIPASTTTMGSDLAIAAALLFEGVLIGGDINIIRLNTKEYCSKFLANYLTTVCKDQIIERTQGITIIHLYGKSLFNVDIKVPSLKEQIAIAHVLSGMDTEIDALKNQLDKIKFIKHGMMQELLTGRIRLI